MALTETHKETKFSIGDTVRVNQKIQEGEKTRTQIFEGMVIAIKNRGLGRTFTVRRIGAQKIGIEQIFPLSSPNIEKIEVVRKGLEGVRHSKLYYTRGKSTREIEKIYSRVTVKIQAQSKSKKTTKSPKKASAK